MTRQLAVEGAPLGIRANSMSPAYIESPATAAVIDPRQRAEMMSEYLIQRPGTVAEVAELAPFLISDAAAWISGTNVVIDGGWTAGAPPAPRPAPPRR